MKPTISTVASPSGHIYEREAILEYILHHLDKVKIEEEEAKKEHQLELKEEETKTMFENFVTKENFKRTMDGASVQEAPAHDASGKRKREIDDSSDNERMAQLSKSSPWLPSFTPDAEKIK